MVGRQVTHENIIKRMRIIFWITKATDTHSEHVIFTAFPLQKLLHTRLGVIRTLHVLLGFRRSVNYPIVWDMKQQRWVFDS
jgi:hypothetical protein